MNDTERNFFAQGQRQELTEQPGDSEEWVVSDCIDMVRDCNLLMAEIKKEIFQWDENVNGSNVGMFTQGTKTLQKAKNVFAHLEKIKSELIEVRRKIH